MANKHKAICFVDKTFRKLFSMEERENLNPVYFKGGIAPKRKHYWIFVPGSETEIRVFTDECVVTCKKIDPAKGPFYATLR